MYKYETTYNLQLNNYSSFLYPRESNASVWVSVCPSTLLSCVKIKLALHISFRSCRAGLSALLSLPIIRTVRRISHF